MSVKSNVFCQSSLKTVFMAGGACFLLISTAFAGDMVYTPINPAFGGSPSNYSYLDGSAQHQNHPQQKRDALNDPKNKSAIEQLNAASQQALFAQIATKLTNSVFGTGTGSYVKGSTFMIGTTTVTVLEKTGTSVTLTLSDGITSTTVTVPIT